MFKVALKGKKEGVVFGYITLAFLISLGISMLNVLEGFERIDTVVYTRYIENVIGPIFLVGLGYIYLHRLSMRQWIIYAFALAATGGITLHILCKVDSGSFVDVCSVGMSRFFSSGDVHKFCSYSFVFAIIFSLAISVLLIKKKRCFFAGILICVGWIYLKQYPQVNTIENYQKYKTYNNERIARILREEEEIIYIRDSEYDAYCVNVKYLQFWIPDTAIYVEDIQNADFSETGIYIVEKGSTISEERKRKLFIIEETEEYFVYKK